jgi:MFS family permease
VLRPLRRPALALMWGGLATSALGDQLFLVALTWVAVQVLGRDAGYLTAVQPATALAVALLAGHWADRVAHRALMIAADLGRAAVLCFMVVVWLAAGLPPAWLLVLAVLALAAGQTLFRPALQAALPGLVGDPAMLPAANGLFETTERIARLLGPGLVALLAAVVPLVHYVSIDVGTFLVSAGAIALTMRLRRLPHAVHRSAGVLDSMARGFRALRSHRVLGFALCTIGPGAGVWYAILFLAVPLLLARRPHGGLAEYGAVLASYGLTNILGALVVGGMRLPRRPGWLIFGGDMVLGAGLGSMGLVALLLPPGWLVPGLCAAAGFASLGGPMHDIPVAVLRQTRLPPTDQAAAMRALLAAMSLSTLLAMAAAPALFGAAGVAPSVAGGGVLIVLLGLAGVIARGRTVA